MGRTKIGKGKAVLQNGLETIHRMKAPMQTIQKVMTRIMANNQRMLKMGNGLKSGPGDFSPAIILNTTNSLTSNVKIGKGVLLCIVSSKQRPNPHS